MRRNRDDRELGALTVAKPPSTTLKVTLALVLGATLVVAARYLHLQEWPRPLLAWMKGLGPWAPVLFIMAYIAATVMFVPGTILTLGAGVIFGVVRGSIIVSIAATLGAVAAFLSSRYLAREWVARKLAGNALFDAIDAAIAAEGWKIVGLLRLCPVIPFNLLNYALGVTRVSLRDYALASFLGMWPATVVYVYAGSLIGDLASLAPGQRQRTTAQSALYVMGLVISVVVSIYITRVARRALDKRIAR